MFTERLEVRLPVETDRARFVELFCDDAFMEYSGGVLEPESASRRFDHMLEVAAELPFAKQPVIERSSGVIVGYAGVDHWDFEGEPRLEFGWRLAREARGKGYATEASRAVLDVAAESYRGEILAMIDPRNDASQNVARKLGFMFWKEAFVDPWVDRVYRLQLGGQVATSSPDERERTPTTRR